MIVIPLLDKLRQSNFWQFILSLLTFRNQFGNVCERYWLSSIGLAILVDPLAPLFVSMKNGKLALFSAFRTPYRQHRTHTQHHFQYRIFQHENIRDLHLMLINRFIGKPTQTPDHRMLIEPIWSTWAQFKQNINTEKVINYAQEIVSRNFPRSQICIDDDWTPHYVCSIPRQQRDKQ